MKGAAFPWVLLNLSLIKILYVEGDGGGGGTSPF